MAACIDAVLKLPAPARRLIFEAVPADTRLRCREVSRAWRDHLSDAALWRHLDLSNSSGVAAHVSDALLTAAAARAGGGLLSLNLYHERQRTMRDTRPNPKAEAISVRLSALVRVLRGNASLQRVRVNLLWLRKSEDPWEGWAPAYSHYVLDLAELRQLRDAAPADASLEVGLDVMLADHEFRTEQDEEGGGRQLIPATCNGLLAALRREAPYTNVHIHTLSTSYGFFRNHADAPAAMRALFGALGAHDALQSLWLYQNHLDDAATLDALLKACGALPQLRKISLISMRMPRDVPTLLPVFTRLVAECSELRKLEFVGGYYDEDPITGAEDVAAFCDALRASRHLETLEFRFGMISVSSTVEFKDVAAGAAVMAALRDVPSFKTLKINNVVHTFNSGGSA